MKVSAARGEPLCPEKPKSTRIGEARGAADHRLSRARPAPPRLPAPRRARVRVHIRAPRAALAALRRVARALR
jgi:hypothetical protein